MFITENLTKKAYFTFSLQFFGISIELVPTFLSFICPIIIYFASTLGSCFAFKLFGLDSVGISSDTLNSLTL